MKMVLARLSIFFIGLPAILALVVLLPQHNHLALNSVIIMVSSIGAKELSQILMKDAKTYVRIEAALLGATLPIGVFLTQYIGAEFPFLLVLLSISIIWVISSRIFSSPTQLECIKDDALVGFSVILYPGGLLLWIIPMTKLNYSSIVIVTFLLCVFANDSLAWLVGMLLGRNNRGIVSISPNKSLAGFIGGVFGSVLMTMTIPLLYPKAFKSPIIPAFMAYLLLGLGSGLASIIGDLAESTLKRSSNIKDSGTIIPGRGGILDSIDSLSLAAPVFFGLYYLLFCQ